MGRASKNGKTQLMKKPYLSWTGKERLRGLLHWAPGSGRAFELKWGGRHEDWVAFSNAVEEEASNA